MLTIYITVVRYSLVMSEQDSQLSHNSLEQALERFETLEELRQRKAEAGPATSGLFDDPIRINQELVDDLIRRPEVADALMQHIEDFQRDSSTLQKLGNKALEGMDSDKLEEAGAQLADTEKTPLHRLALYHALHTTKEEHGKAFSKTDIFLSRHPNIVADEMVDKKLQFNGRTVEIKNVRPQPAPANERYVSTRPIFGESRCDVYAGAVRGRYMLFFRAGDDNDLESCVTIMQAQDSDGSQYSSPTRVTEALGIKQELVGNARLDGNMFILELTERTPNRAK